MNPAHTPTTFTPANAFEAMALLEQEARNGDTFLVGNDQVAGFVRAHAARLNLSITVTVNKVLYRVALESVTGETGHGEPSTDLPTLKAWRDEQNQEHKYKVHHWIEVVP